MKKLLFILSIFTIIGLSSCSENYSNGERIGYITKFSRSGIMFKSWEGHLNLTQTGMNSAEGFDFSIDNDNEDSSIVSIIDSAATNGWKVKLVYHQVVGYNWFQNRGNTDYFITQVQVLDKNTNSPFNNSELSVITTSDTISDSIK